MFPQPILGPWTRLFASLALEAVLVFALTALLALLVRSASGQRMVWRVSFAVLAALVLAELSGVGHTLLRQQRTSPRDSVSSGATVVTTTVIADRPLPIAQAPTPATVPEVPAMKPRTRPSSSLAWWLPVLALAGLAWVGARRSFGALRLFRLGRRASSDPGDLAARVQALGRRLGIRRRVRIKSLEGLSSPIAFGIFRPTVGVPMDFSVRFTAAQREAMLAHELAHVAAFDALWMLLADLITALLWWHPAAWWARRQLRAASETAADEASLLLDDGPATLAECLVTLGDLLTRSPDPGGLGMAGFRFRSELGRRVERLLQLREQSRHPWRGVTAWLARFLVPGTLLGLALAVTAWLLPPAASAASLREAFQGSPLGLATTALLTADKQNAPRLIYRGKEFHDEVETNDTATLLLQGKKLYDTGKTNEAEAKWRTVLELDPDNKVALDYLAGIGRTNSLAAKPSVQSGDLVIPGRSAGTNLVYTSVARQKIYQRLNTIRLESVKFIDVPLQQVIEVLSKEVRNRDPERKGVNFVINTIASPAPAIDPATGLPTPAPKTPEIDPATGLPATSAQASSVPEIDPATGLPTLRAAPGAGEDIGAAIIRIDPELKNVTLQQMLDIIVKVADKPLKYSVEDYGVILSPRTASDPPQLHTRWFKIDPRTFLQGMKAVRTPNSGTSNKVPLLGDLPYMRKLFRSDEVSSERGGFPTTQTPQEIVIPTIRTYFESLGVNLDPPKSIIFNDLHGRLMVRATLAELDVIEQAVAVLNTAPPQVHIEVKFYEVPEDSLKALGFDWFLGSVASDPLGAPGQRRQNAENSTASVDSGHRNPSTNAALTSLTGILTPQQYRVVLRALEEREGVTFLRAFKVTTLSSRQAQVKSVEVRTIVTGLDTTNKAPAKPGESPEYPLITSQFELGPMMDVVPYVAANGRAIQMTVIPSIKEFIGYEVDEDFSKKIWDYVPLLGATPPPGSQYPLPIFRLRQVVFSASVWDGQTLVLASRTVKTSLPDGHIANKLPKALADEFAASIQRMRKSPPKAMVVFITPMIIDAAGNLLHTDADIPERTNSVPTQLPPAR